MGEYTITIKGPEGTEIHEGSGFLLFLQKPVETGDRLYKTSVMGEHFNDSLLPEALMQNRRLIQQAFAAVGLAIGKHFAPPDPADIKKLIEALDQRYGDDEDDGDEDDE